MSIGMRKEHDALVKQTKSRYLAMVEKQRLLRKKTYSPVTSKLTTKIMFCA